MSDTAAPAFSIVVTAFNEEELVGAAIESALAQSERNLELIVVDDGSTDRTAEVVRGFSTDPRLRLVEQENRGLSAARNAGIAEARAELIVFLDSDDLLLPDYLEKMGEALSARPDAGFAYTDAWLLDDGTNRFGRASAMSYNRPPADPPQDPAAFLTLLMRSNFIFVSTTVRRTALATAGLFDEALTACEDYDLWLRILAAGFEAARVPGRPAIKRQRAGAMTADHRNMFANLQRVCHSAAASPDLPAEARRIASERDARLGVELELLDRGAGAAATAKARLMAVARAMRRPFVERRAWLAEPPAEISSAFRNEEWRRRRATGEG